MRRANSEYVCMHVCMFEAPKHACMFEIVKRACMFDTCEHVCMSECLSMYVCLQACLYGCMFETPDVAILILLAGALTRSNYIRKLD